MFVTSCTRFRAVMALDFHDGPLMGIAYREIRAEAYFFQALAWDEESWTRIFAVTCVTRRVAQDLLEAGAAFDRPCTPFWQPQGPPSLQRRRLDAAKSSLIAAAHESAAWSLLESHDLYRSCRGIALSETAAQVVQQDVIARSFDEIGEQPLLEAYVRLRLAPHFRRAGTLLALPG